MESSSSSSFQDERRQLVYQMIQRRYGGRRLAEENGQDGGGGGQLTRKQVTEEVLRTLDEIEKQERQLSLGSAIDNGAADVSRLFNNGQEVIINIFSTSVYNTLVLYSDGFVMLAVVVLVFVLWVITNAPVRSWLIPQLTRYTLKGQSEQWKDVLLKMNNFFTMLLMFVVFQFVANQLTTAWIGAAPDAGESIVGAFVISMLVFATLSIVSSF